MWQQRNTKYYHWILLNKSLYKLSFWVAMYLFPQNILVELRGIIIVWLILTVLEELKKKKDQFPASSLQLKFYINDPIGFII